MAALQFTYAQLKAALQYWLVEQTTSLAANDFTANVDTIIKIGELKLARDLDFTIFDAIATVNTSAATESVTKPTGYLSPIVIFYTSGSTIQDVAPRTYEYVKDYGGVGSPLFYADKDTTTWVLAPVSATTVELTVRYIKRPESVVVDTSGSWLSLNCADALLYACLIASEEFLKDSGQIGVWTKKYEDEVLPRTKQEFASLARARY